MALHMRVVQKNLVFVHGLPQGIDHTEKYRKLQQTFKDFGPVVKCVVNNKTSYVGSQIPRASVYITYQRIEDALKAYKSLPSRIEDYEVKTSLGTTKYCSNFLKNTHCPKQVDSAIPTSDVPDGPLRSHRWLSVGFCRAPYHDGCYYEAKVLSVDGNCLIIQFMGYGDRHKVEERTLRPSAGCEARDRQNLEGEFCMHGMSKVGDVFFTNIHAAEQALLQRLKEAETQSDHSLPSEDEYETITIEDYLPRLKEMLAESFKTKPVRRACRKKVY